MKASSAMGVIPTGRVKDVWDKRKKKVWDRVETFTVPFRVDLS